MKATYRVTGGKFLRVCVFVYVCMNEIGGEKERKRERESIYGVIIKVDKTKKKKELNIYIHIPL